MKKIMMNSLVLALFAGNAFSSAPASSSGGFSQGRNLTKKELLEQAALRGKRLSPAERRKLGNQNLQQQKYDFNAAASSSSAPRIVPVAPFKFTKEDLGEGLNGILGKVAFKDRNQAKLHGVSFDNNNAFARRELVVVPLGFGNEGQFYGLVLGRKEQSNLWYVQRSPIINAPFVLEETVATEAIGKMLIKSAPMQRAAGMGVFAPGGPAIEQVPGEEEQERPSEEQELRARKLLAIKAQELIRAADRGRTDIVQALLAIPGIDVNVQDKLGNTALIQAASRGRIDIVQALLAIPGIDVNLQNKIGNTAIRMAVKGHIETVRALLAKRADVNIVGNEGETAYSIAIKMGYIDIAKLIEKAGEARPASSWASRQIVSESQGQAASMAPGGPAIEPGEEEEEGKEQVEGRLNRSEGQIEGLPSVKK